MLNTEQNIGELLSDPFEEQDLEWRVQRSGLTNKKKPWVVVIAYVTNRAIMQRLDDVFGVDGWENVYQEAVGGKGYLCGIKAKFGDRWVTKWDGAEYTNVESLKGALSGAMKRAAVQFGIGRYLYNLDEEFAECQPVDSRYNCSPQGNFIGIKGDKFNKNAPRFNAEWYTPILPEWARPSVKANTYIEAIKNADDLEKLKDAFTLGYKYANSFSKRELLKQLTQLKDAKKAELEQNIADSKVGNQEKIGLWLDQQLADYIETAANESVLKLNKKKVLTELSQKALGLKVSPSEYIKKLNLAASNKLEQLNNRG